MLAGRTLNGRYDVLELIASGGMGEVYRARDRELDELVALKVIRTDRADDDMVARFRHEVKLARRVTHANVARTFELGHADGVVFCTMELVEGETLAHRLAREHRLAVRDAVGIAAAVCDALIAAHAAGVIHRDIKPANVLIAHDGRVVLADFGIASASVAGLAETSGTPAYMAPEQARGEPPTPATDVYAVGLILYEMLTGQRAFTGTLTQIGNTKDLARLVPTGGEISQDLAEVVAAAAAARVEERIATAGELRGALARWAPDAQTPRPARRVEPRGLENRTVVVIAPHTDDARLHIAAEIHEELLATLGRSTLRVLPRTEQTLVPARLVVRFDVRDTLVMSVTGDDSAFTVALPLAIDQISRAVAIAASAITAAVDAKPQAHADAYDLLLRARQAARIGAVSTTTAADLAERAVALTPDDPRIQAVSAIQLVRAAFFFADSDAATLRLAGQRVRAALASGLATAHLAAGHYELHTGDASVAASHYRIAIARAPYLAEAHEHLGNVLIEAGYLDAAIARFEEAHAIAGRYAAISWDIARAMALEGRWDEHDRLVGEAEIRRRPLAVARTAWWRGDLAQLRALRLEAVHMYPDEMLNALFDVFLDDAWPRVRDVLLASAFENRAASRRRTTLVAQIVAEAAGHAGDLDACERVLRYAGDCGLFDLHWLDRAPTLAAIRHRSGFASIRALVEARARAIYDALHGDHAVATADTAASTS